MDLLEQAFLDKLQHDALLAPVLTFETVHLNAGPTDARTDLQRQIDQLTRKISRLREAFLAGADSVEEYSAAKRSMESRLADLRHQLESLDGPTDAAPQDLLRQAILATLETLRSPTVSLLEKHAAVTSVISSCTFQRKPESVLSLTYRLVL